MSEIKPGDVVQLKTGGLKMVVESINGGIATCLYSLDQSKPMQKVGVVGRLERIKLGVVTLKLTE